MGGAVPKRWRSVWCMLCAMHVWARLCRRAAYVCCLHRSLQLGCYHGVARNWGAALPRCGCMPVCGVSILHHTTSPLPPLSPVNKPPACCRGSAESLGFPLFLNLLYICTPDSDF